MSEPANPEKELAARARRWLLVARHGTLCTQSTDAEHPAWPFGSLAPFALGEDGAPIILISDLAEHTRNLLADPRVSLFVQDPESKGDPQTTWRLTVVGTARRVMRRTDPRAAAAGEDPLALDDAAFDELHARYCARVPDASRYFEVHGFDYWRIEPLRVRAIGGFGAIDWLGGASLLRGRCDTGMAAAERAVRAHLGAGLESALLELCAFAAPALGPPAGAQLLRLDRTGCFVSTDGPDELRYFEFAREIRATDAVDAFMSLVGAARASAARSRSPATRPTTSADLLAGGDTLQIHHQGSVYTLRITRHGRMILTK